ncbi:MAG: M48 family metallopeptidase [Armatimonadota bacterium]
MPYTVRVSPRAKHARLLLSLRDGGLTVVIPRGFDRRQIPEMIQEKQAWIERARRRILEQRRRAGAESGDGLPALISLRAIGEQWRVEYRRDGDERRAPADNRVLTVSGAIEDAEGCRQAVCRWLHRKARAHLVPRLLELSREHKLPVTRVTIRSQRTRWGSCTERRSISLNGKLLFLPPRLVEQVMVHELCHTVHHNHSKQFWGLVESLSPGCAELEAALRTAWSYVPTWFEQ